MHALCIMFLCRTSDSVIEAWELGIATMKRGEIAIFHCQPKYAHGKKGLPSKVPPNAAVSYEIEVFSWRGKLASYCITIEKMGQK